jgi:hypothetical protein
MTRRWTPTALILGAGLLFGCATIQNTPEQDRTCAGALWALRTWLDSWSGFGRIAVDMAH